MTTEPDQDNRDSALVRDIRKKIAGPEYYADLVKEILELENGGELFERYY